MGGWIKIHRKIIYSPIFQSDKLLKVWLWCLASASHKNSTTLVGLQSVSLNPGEFVFGRKKASQTLGISEMMVRGCMRALESGEYLTIKATNKFSIIHIINWDTYQQNDENDNQQPNQQTTNKQPTNNQQITTFKNDKERKEDKEDKEGVSDKPKPLPKKIGIKWDWNKNIFEIEDWQWEEFETLFPRHDIKKQIGMAAKWQIVNQRRYRDWRRFFLNWLKNAKEDWIDINDRSQW